jgi:hypothetical protein
MAADPRHYSESPLAKSLNLLLDWASPTRMGRLRGAGAVGALAAAFTWWADLHVLAGGPRAGAWGIAGTLALPLLAAGYWHVAEALREAVPRAAGIVRLGGIYAVALGTAVHALLVGSPGSVHSPLAIALVVAIVVAITAISLAFFWAVLARQSDYPLWIVSLSPAPLGVAVWLALRSVPAWQASSEFSAIQVAHFLFFAISAIVIEYHNPDRWHP